MIVTPDTLATVLKAKPWGWDADSLTDVVIKGVVFTAATEQPVLRLVNSARVTLDGCTFRGSLEAPFGIGITTERADRLTIRKCVFEGLATGSKLIDGDGLVFEDCEMRAIRADGLIFSGQRDYRIDRNAFADWRPVGLKHPDAIQAIRPDARSKPSERGKIRSNTLALRGAQGIFVPQTIGTEISDNFICTDASTAIGLAKSQRCIVRNNAIGTYPPSTTQAGIDVREAVGLICDEASRPHQYRWRKAAYAATAV